MLKGGSVVLYIRAIAEIHMVHFFLNFKLIFCLRGNNVQLVWLILKVIKASTNTTCSCALARQNVRSVQVCIDFFFTLLPGEKVKKDSRLLSQRTKKPALNRLIAISKSKTRKVCYERKTAGSFKRLYLLLNIWAKACTKGSFSLNPHLMLLEPVATPLNRVSKSELHIKVLKLKQKHLSSNKINKN